MQGPQLARLASSDVGDGVVLRSTSIWKTRLDPTSAIRFQNAKGDWSDWIAGDAMHVTNGWVYKNAVADVLDFATRIEIRELDPEMQQAVAVSRPSEGTTLVIEPDGTAVVTGPSAALHRWIRSFFEVVHATHPGDTAQCTGPRDIQDACARNTAYDHVRYTLNGAPLGVWTVYFDNRIPIELAGELLYNRLEHGLGTRFGWRLEDAERAEVRSLSGSLTLGAIVGTSALAVALLPVAALARGSSLFPGDGPRTGGSAWGSGSSNVTASDLLDLGGAAGGDDDPPGTWKPALADQAGLDAPKLFKSSARRKAIVQLVATASANVDSRRGSYLVQGGAAVARFRQLFEVGMGGLHLVSSRHGDLRNDAIVHARFGLHLPLDAAHRVAIPLSLDLGGGGGEPLGVFFRFNWGLRIKLSEHAFVGVAPATPTLLNWKHDPTRRKGSISSGVELGVVW